MNPDGWTNNPYTSPPTAFCTNVLPRFGAFTARLTLSPAAQVDSVNRILASKSPWAWQRVKMPSWNPEEAAFEAASRSEPSWTPWLVPLLCWSVNQTAPFRLVPSKLSLIRYGNCDPVWESPALALNDAAGSTAALDPANTAVTAAQATSNTIRLNTGAPFRNDD